MFEDDIDSETMELMGFFGDPLIDAEITSLARNAAMMGIDLSNPVIMSGFFDNLSQKVKSMLGGKTITVDTGKGTAKIGPGEISYVTTTPGGTSVATVPKTGGITDMLKNPVILGTIIGVPLLLILMKNSGRKPKKEYLEGD
jgi:phosphohistidine swiveling domain-containing protein